LIGRQRQPFEAGCDIGDLGGLCAAPALCGGQPFSFRKRPEHSCFVFARRPRRLRRIGSSRGHPWRPPRRLRSHLRRLRVWIFSEVHRRIVLATPLRCIPRPGPGGRHQCGFCRSARGNSPPRKLKTRQEREFWDRRPGVEIAAFPRTETGISLSGDEKPRQSRAFLDSLCKTPKQRTGWWRMQSNETGLSSRSSLLTGNLQGILRI
jgi:hypothetical protein